MLENVLKYFLNISPTGINNCEIFEYFQNKSLKYDSLYFRRLCPNSISNFKLRPSKVEHSGSTSVNRTPTHVGIVRSVPRISPTTNRNLNEAKLFRKERKKKQDEP